jgi:hypothetical protein
MSNSFSDRQLIEVRTRQVEDIIHPQYIVIVGSRSDGVNFKVDIGRVCYTNRENDSGNLRHKNKRYITGLVDKSTLSIERTKWLRRYLLEILHKGWRDETVRGRLHALRYFFNFCDSKGSKPLTLEDLVSNYKYYQISLYQQARLSGKKLISATTLYSKLHTARNFIKIAFELSDTDMLNIIPKHRYMGYSGKERESSLEDFKNYIQTCITYFNEFSDAILNNIYPIPITLGGSSSNDYYWDSISLSGIKKLTNCFDNKGEPLPFDDIKHILANYYGNETSQKVYYQNTLIKYRKQWINEVLNSKKSYAYNLCTYCFYYIYLAFTAANIQPTLDLKISDLNIENLGLSTFARKHKYRAGRQVEFSAPPQLKRYLIQYLKLREWVDSLGLSGDCEEYLFVRIGEHRQLKRFARNSISSTDKDSHLFKELKRINARDIRNLCAEYYIKHSKGNLSLVARKLDNSLAIVAKSYTSINIESQAIEMNQYHEKASTAILRSNRTNNQTIPIKTSTDYDVERIPTGSCSNLSDSSPTRAIGFNDEVLAPSCATFESCLFCEFFAIHIDFEDIHKLLSLREALLKSSEIRNDPEHHLNAIEPSLYRIEEIINVLQKKDSKVIDLINDAKQDIGMQIYNKYWSKHIEFLTLASQDSDKGVDL